MSRTILLTGGLGFIGSHCALVLIQHGYNVVICDSLSNSNTDTLDKIQTITGKRPTFYPYDINNRSGALDYIFSHHAIHTVIHLAGFKAVNESVNNPLKYYDNNVCGTVSLLKCMVKHKVQNIIFSSSATVYGIPEALPLTEESKIEPINPYGRTKLMIEDILRDLAHTGKIKVISLRYFNPVGCHPSLGENPKTIPTNIFPVIVSCYRNKSVFQIYGSDYETQDGTAIRDYIHVMDLALGHVNSIEYFNRDFENEVFNLGTGKGYSVMQIVEQFENITGKQLFYEMVERREGDAPEVYTSGEKAKQFMGWEAEKNLHDMVLDTVTYHDL
jgi:UDP-glucose 4-epimerase